MRIFSLLLGANLLPAPRVLALTTEPPALGAKSVAPKPEKTKFVSVPASEAATNYNYFHLMSMDDTLLAPRRKPRQIKEPSPLPRPFSSIPPRQIKP